jgi:hypothetical protein
MASRHVRDEAQRMVVEDLKQVMTHQIRVVQVDFGGKRDHRLTANPPYGTAIQVHELCLQ